MNQHERPYHCSLEECPYAELGFETEKHLRQHEEKSHPTGQTSEWVFPVKKPRKQLDILSASQKGDLATIERLVGEGADINQTSRPGGSITALSLAVKFNHSQVVSYLIGQRCEQSDEILGDAFVHASTAIIQMLLDMEADPG